MSDLSPTDQSIPGWLSDAAPPPTPAPAAPPETLVQEFEGSLSELVGYLHRKILALEADVKALVSKA